MRRLAEIKGAQPRRGYIAKCSRCGLRVVHERSTNAPVAIHARSKLCALLYERRTIQRRLPLD